MAYTTKTTFSSTRKSAGESEKSLRERNPGLKALWDQYQTMLNLVDDRPKVDRGEARRLKAEENERLRKLAKLRSVGAI